MRSPQQSTVQRPDSGCLPSHGLLGLTAITYDSAVYRLGNEASIDRTKNVDQRFAATSSKEPTEYLGTQTLFAVSVRSVLNREINVPAHGFQNGEAVEIVAQRRNPDGGLSNHSAARAVLCNLEIRDDYRACNQLAGCFGRNWNRFTKS